MRQALPRLVVHARTDVFLFAVGRPEDRFADALDRAAQARTAGADSLFAPGLLTWRHWRRWWRRADCRVNVMAGPGAPSIQELGRAGARRVSFGSAIAQAAYSVVRRATAELLAKGTYTEMESADEFDSLSG